MSVSDPTVIVDCDAGCGSETSYGLTKLAGRGWDDRNLGRQMERDGWVKQPDGRLFCPDCDDEAKEAASSNA